MKKIVDDIELPSARANSKIADHVRVEKKFLGGVETYVTTSVCASPVAEAHFIKGFKSDINLYKKLIRTLHDNNINAVMVTLPDPADEVNYLEDYEKIAKAVFVDGELDKSGFPPTPKFAVTHSTGGYLLTKLLMDEQNAKTIARRYQSALFAAPYYGTKWHRMPYIGSVGKIYSDYHADKPVGMTWLERTGTSLLERLFSAASGYNDGTEDESILENEDLKALANHKQGLYMDGPTAQLIQDIAEKGFPEIARSFPTFFLTAARDKVCYNPLAVQVANQINGQHFEIKGGHSLLRKTQEGPSFLLDVIKVRLHEMKMEALEKQGASAQRLLPFFPPAPQKNRPTTSHHTPPAHDVADPDMLPA